MSALGLSFMTALLLGLEGRLASWIFGAALFGVTLVLALLQPGMLTSSNLALAGLSVVGFNVGLCAVFGIKVLITRPALTA